MDSNRTRNEKRVSTEVGFVKLKQSVKRMNRRLHYVHWLVLIAVLTTGLYTNYNLRGLRHDIQVASVPKFIVTDVQQFDVLCKQLVEQWGGVGYAAYLIQPNAPTKTHKELIATTMRGVPAIARLTSYEILKESTVSSKLSKIQTPYYTTTVEKMHAILNNDNPYVLFGAASLLVPDEHTGLTVAMFPVYRNSIIVAELYVTFDCNIQGPAYMSKLLSSSSEAQQLSLLIQ